MSILVNFTISGILLFIVFILITHLQVIVNFMWDDLKNLEHAPVYVLLLSVDKWHSIVMCSICFARCRVDSTTAIKLLTPYLNCLLVIIIYWRGVIRCDQNTRAKIRYQD